MGFHACLVDLKHKKKDMEKMEIKATANYSKKTFTIRIYDDGKCYTKYRTLSMSTQEFDDCQYFTQHDWKDWLRHSQCYYKVK